MRRPIASNCNGRGTRVGVLHAPLACVGDAKAGLRIARAARVGGSKREAGAAVRAEPRPAGINIAAQRPGANKGGREEEKRSGRFAGCPTKLRSDENGFVACGAPAAGRNSRSDTILRRKFRAAQHRFMRYRG
jgi:hypothetical protein